MSSPATPAPTAIQRPARLAMLVIERLVERIVSGEFPTGSVLPPEPALCAEFGVSRTVVREALKVLEEKGLVHIRQGHGTAVKAPDSWNLLDPVVLAARIKYDESLEVLDQLVAVRACLEADMAAEAAKQISETELQALEELLRRMEQLTGDASAYLEADVRFHDLVMRASGNQLGRVIVGSIHDKARADLRYTAGVYQRQIPDSHQGHLAIYACIAAHDSAGAADAMRHHIRDSWIDRKRLRATSAEQLEEDSGGGGA
jgi:DNA-binding FadR family transcriptional regulator